MAIAATSSSRFDVYADVGELVRNADFLAQRQHPFEETVEAALDAEIGGGPFDILFDLAAVGLQHVGHDDAVEHSVMGIIETAKRMRQRMDGAEPRWKAVAPMVEATSMLPRASRSFGFFTAFARLSFTSRMPSSATPTDSG